MFWLIFLFRPVDPKSFFRVWLNKIQEKFKEKTGYTHVSQDGSQSSQHHQQQPSAVVLATQSAAFSVLSVPIMLDCNRPPKRRTTDIKLKDLQLAKQTLLLHPHTSKTEALKESKQVCYVSLVFPYLSFFMIGEALGSQTSKSKNMI